MKLKASELVGKPLDFAVGLLDQKDWSKEDLLANMQRGDDGYIYSPSTIRDQGYRIVEEEGIELYTMQNSAGQITGWNARRYYSELDVLDSSDETGETPLLAAMRCFVSTRSRWVDVPEELLR